MDGFSGNGGFFIRARLTRDLASGEAEKTTTSKRANEQQTISKYRDIILLVK